MQPAAEIFLTREQSREIDRLAMDRYSIPGLLLMETAGRNAATYVQNLLGEGEHQVTIACGAGNNGGDGYVIARYLHLAGNSIVILAATPIADLSGDAKVNADIVRALGIPVHDLDDHIGQATIDAWIEPSAVLLDALLGTGFVGTIRPPLARKLAMLKSAVQKSETKVVAVDLPSGMDADSGSVDANTLNAFATVTFVAKKKGFKAPAASKSLGTISVQGIGIPPGLIQQILAK